jgi:hypothetical protein
MLATTNTGNAVVGFVIIGIFLLVIAGLVAGLVRANGRATKAEGERNYLRWELERLHSQYMGQPPNMYPSQPPNMYPAQEQRWSPQPPPGAWPPPGTS